MSSLEDRNPEIEYHIDLIEGAAQAADAIAFSAGGTCTYTNSVRGVKDVARIVVPAEQREHVENLMNEDDRVTGYAER